MSQNSSLRNPIKLGKYSLAITLPEKFIKNNKIKSGIPLNVLHVEPSDGSDIILIFPNKEKIT